MIVVDIQKGKKETNKTTQKINLFKKTHFELKRSIENIEKKKSMMTLFLLTFFVDIYLAKKNAERFFCCCCIDVEEQREVISNRF